MNDDHSVSSEATPVESSTTSKMEGSGRSGSSGSSSFSLARGETMAVQKTKKILVASLFLSALIVTGITFYLLSSAERDDFESKFHGVAMEISELIHHEAHSVFLAAEALSLTVTSFVMTSKTSWPLVSIPHFEARGAKSNELCNSLLTAFSPVVFNTTRLEWESYSVKNQGWIQEGVDFNIDLHQDFINGTFDAAPISKQIFRYENGKSVVENDIGPYLPVWQLAPAPHDDSIINFNLLSHPVFSRVYHAMLETKEHVLSEVLPLDFLYGGSMHDMNNPHSFLFQPVYKNFNEEHSEEDIAGVVISILPWDHYFTNLLPNDVNGITVVLGNICDQAFTYMINGKEAIYIGPGNIHDPNYDNLLFETDFDVNHNLNVSHNCAFFLRIYPTKRLEDAHKTKQPLLYSLAVLVVFSFTSMVFIVYDKLVQKRQAKVMGAAKRSDAIVSSIFPSNIRDRIMKEAEEQEQHADKKGHNKTRFSFAKSQLKSFLETSTDEEQNNAFGSKPIADLFPSATVMFADIVGFTAWSSVREPSQVFQLLETLYHGFDEIARRRHVFKVETIGDCYVAVTGLPEPRQDHAVAMARFARDVLSKMNDLAKKLEIRLGPDTGDLCMRIGMNSGPVTAGVLRGEKARFQLFGDTVNTAARMESTGERNRIHVSQETATLLQAAGKSHWLFQREDKVFAKGKGELHTYWVGVKLQSSSSTQSGTTTSSNGDYAENLDVSTQTTGTIQKLSQTGDGSGDKEPIAAHVRSGSLTESMRKPILSDKVERLVSWNADVLVKLLKQITARRNAAQRSDSTLSASPPVFVSVEGTTVLDEVKEIIKLPRFDAKAIKNQENPNTIELDPNVTTQLHDYITIVATLYRDNPFHNFEHASHVTMSVIKLLSRIVAPDEILEDYCADDNSDHFDRNLHDHTYGITSDPLTQFAVVFSALIHDVDHTGVPNTQLVKENAIIAAIYKNKSVAEQNSVDIAWDLLMDDTFKDLRAVIYTNQCELNRFRQLVVNAVMATDIVDKELKDLRNARWDKAFKSDQDLLDAQLHQNDVNRKATIVIEHLIQASDVAHTMQHWHIYRKWNERFFQEMYHAYKTGRAEKDPSEFWYKGEIGFFDFYIIPLAKKLRDCGVFGVSCDEYLNYAMANRKEWEIKGQEVVDGMIAKYKEEQFCYSAEQCKLGDEKKASIA